MSDREMVSIPKEDLISLIEEAAWGIALDAAGVDNWSGREYAVEVLDSVTNDLLKVHGISEDQDG